MKFVRKEAMTVMRKKLTVNRVAMGNLRTRRKQYTLLIFGIIFAMTFCSGSLFFLSSLDSTLNEIHYSRYGRQCVIQMNCPDSFDPEALLTDGTINAYGYFETIAYGYSSEDEYTHGISICKADSTARTLSNQTLLSGTLPEKEGEIAAEKTALVSLGYSEAEIGDDITLIIETPDGNGGALSETATKTYKLTGILSDKRLWLMSLYEYRFLSLPQVYTDLPAVFVSSEEEIVPGGKAVRHCYIGAADQSYSTRVKLFEALEALRGADGELTTMNTPTFRKSVESTGRSPVSSVSIKALLAVALTVILLAASCFAIANAFNSNLQQRRTQIGMLRALGATKRQIISIFGRETFIISLICTPVSMALSYAAVFFVTRLMGSEFVFRPKLYALFLSAAAGVVCVALTSLLPLARASGISPMQAIRNINLSRKMKRKKIVSQKSFDASKLLARRNLVFYSGTRAGVSVIMIVGILLSSLGFTFVEYSRDDYTMGADYMMYSQASAMYLGYLNYTSSGWGLSENDMQRIYDNQYTEKVYGTKWLAAALHTPGQSEYIDFINRSEHFGEPVDDTEEGNSELNKLRQWFGITADVTSVGLMAIDSEDIKELGDSVIHGAIDIDAINSGRQVIMYAPEGLALNILREENGRIMSWRLSALDGAETEQELKMYDSYAYNDFVSVGDEIDFSSIVISEEYSESAPVNYEQRDCKAEVGAIVAKGSKPLAVRKTLAVITSLQGLRAMGISYPYEQLGITLKGKCTKEIDEEYMQFLSAFLSSVNGSHVASNFEMVQSDRAQTMSYMLTVTALVVLMFCLCAAMINNALSARIRESKREIGTLRAVGASQRELVRSYFRQLISMFGVGCGVGLFAYLLAYLGMFIFCRVYESELPSLQLWQPVVFSALMFVLCYSNLRQKVHREMKSSIIENIREL